MSKRMTYVSLAAGLMLPLAAVSAPLSYSHVDASYARTDVDNYDKGDGFIINGQFAFAESWFFTGRYSKASLNPDDLERISAGVGYQVPVAEGTSVYGQATYEHIDINNDFQGYGLEAGLRYAIAPQFEVNGGIEYGDISKQIVDGKVGFKLGGVYDVTPSIGITAGYENIDDLDEWTVGGRFYFGG